METIQVKIDKGEALRYLGYKGGEISADIHCMVECCIQETIQIESSRYVCRIFALERADGLLLLQGSTCTLQGNAIREHLKDCDQCALIAATLGSEFDFSLRTAQIRDMSRAVILDSCGSAAVENICDQIEDRLRIDARKQELYLTDRFSPGYADMPLSMQKGICDVLDTKRKMGLYINDSHILIPRKSVTAVIGLSKIPQQARVRGCAFCDLSATCRLKKDGKTCG